MNNCIGEGNFDTPFELNEFELAYYRKNKGCSICPSGYSKLLITSSNYVCLNSLYVPISENGSKYDMKCDYYFNTI